MTECQEVANGLRDTFSRWLIAEQREFSLYAVRRFVCAELTGETAQIREQVAQALFQTSQQEVENTRLEDMDPGLAGSW
jgi:hypothetical protein